jgi:hypothetical protein
VYDRVKVFRTDGRETSEHHPSVLSEAAVSIVRPGEHNHLVPPFHKASAKLLDVTLDATMRRRDTLLSDHRDLHEPNLSSAAAPATTMKSMATGPNQSRMSRKRLIPALRSATLSEGAVSSSM